MLKDIFYWLLGFLFVLLIWGISSYALNSTDIPFPNVVLKSIITNGAIHIENVSQTATEAIIGLIISVFLSLFCIFTIGMFPKFEKIIYPFILLIKSTPAVAFVPIFIILIGTGVMTKVFVSSMICFFPLIIGGIDGIKRTPERFEILAESYGSSFYNSFLNIKIGYMINGFCSGLKTAAPLSVIGAIVGEYVTGGNQAGLGAFIITNVVKSVKINLYAGAVLSTLLGLSFFVVSNLISNYYDKKLHIGR